MHKLAAYFMTEDGRPIVKRTDGQAIREVNGVPVLGLDTPGFGIKQVGSPGDRTLEIVGSTDDIDRYVEVINVKGWDLKNYRANPVFLFGHNYREPAIGKGVKVWKEPGDGTPGTGKLIFHIKFATKEEYEFADTIYKLYVGQFMRATSVGFLPWDWEDVETAEGKTARGKGKPEVARRIYTKQDLLELSAVPVPANPNALVNAFQKGMVREADMNRFAAMGAIIEREVIDLSAHGLKPQPDHLVEVEELDLTQETVPQADAATAATVASVGQEQASADAPHAEASTETPAASEPTEAAEERGAIGFATHGKLAKKIADQAWTGAAAELRIRKWASSDGSGDVDKLDWSKYRKGFAWFDSANAKTLGAYKLPHHDIVDGQLAHHWRGAVAAMTALLGGRGGTNLPDGDRRAVYSHLVAEYGVFEKEPPEFKDAELCTLCGGDIIAPALRDPETGDAICQACQPQEERRCLMNLIAAGETTGDAWLLVSRDFINGRQMPPNMKIERTWHDESSELSARLLATAQGIAMMKAVKSLPEERFKVIKAGTPEGERVNLGKWPDLAMAFVRELAGEFSNEITVLVADPAYAGMAVVVTAGATVEPQAPSPIPEQTNEHVTQNPPELEIIEVLHTPEDGPKDEILDLELINPNPTPAPQAAPVGDSQVIELDPASLREALGDAISKTLGHLTGDARFIKAHTKHLERR